MSVYRIYVEKKPEFAVEANSLIGGIKSALGLENLTGLRVINRYDAEGLSREDSIRELIPVHSVSHFSLEEKDLLSSQREFILFLANSQKQSLTRSSTI